MAQVIWILTWTNGEKETIEVYKNGTSCVEAYKKLVKFCANKHDAKLLKDYFDREFKYYKAFIAFPNCEKMEIITAYHDILRD